MMTSRYRKILVSLDGSSLAEKALPCAREMAVRFSSEIVLLNVRLPAEDPYHPTLESYLEKTAKTLGQETPNNMSIEIRPLTISTSKVARHPAETIVNYASDENVDLIIMASHGHSGIKHWALGGISDKVLHISNIPVLLIRSNTTGCIDFDNILIPLDGSEVAECIFPHITEIVTGYNSSRAVFLHVVEPFFHPAPGESDDGGHVYTEKEIQEIEYRNKGMAEKYLKQVIKEIGLKGAAVHGEVLAGNVAETIINYAKNNDTDLIIMSTHGHSGMSRWTLGSITERVLHYSDLPILVVRAQGCAI